MRNFKGFTLIELLVVVAIIVTLLTLMMPALDRAIQQAEMAVCAAHQRSLTMAGITYAAGNLRRFPSNKLTRQSSGGYTAALIGWEDDPDRDLRPVLNEYISVKAFACPLAGNVQLSLEDNDTQTQVFAGYDFWMGWQYTGSLGGRGLLRQGDHLGWIDNLDGNRPLTSNLAVSDLNQTHINQLNEASHPDDAATMFQQTAQNQPATLAGVSVLGFGISTFNVTYTAWHKEGNNEVRGNLDLNFGYDDASVSRMTQITPAFLGTDSDPRMHAAPFHADTSLSSTSAKRFLPAMP